MEFVEHRCRIKNNDVIVVSAGEYLGNVEGYVGKKARLYQGEGLQQPVLNILSLYYSAPMLAGHHKGMLCPLLLLHNRRVGRFSLVRIYPQLHYWTISRRWGLSLEVHRVQDNRHHQRHHSWRHEHRALWRSLLRDHLRLGSHRHYWLILIIIVRNQLSEGERVHAEPPELVEAVL